MGKSRHPNKSLHWIIKKYWQTIGNDNWAFAGKEKGIDKTICELFFECADLLEIDQITPQQEGGINTYINFQLLHRHCHDTNTANDARRLQELEEYLNENPSNRLIPQGKRGMHDKHQITEEPDEGKLSRPVLKTSPRGDSPA